MKTLRLWALAGVLLTTAIGAPLLAQEAAAEAAAPAVEEAAPAEAGISLEMFTVNNTWMMVATFLVFIMHLGFSMIESGLCQAKNTVNILFKNTLIIAIGLLTYALMGFNLMYPGFADGDPGYFAFAGFGISDLSNNLTNVHWVDQIPFLSDLIHLVHYSQTFIQWHDRTFFFTLNQ